MKPLFFTTAALLVVSFSAHAQLALSLSVANKPDQVFSQWQTHPECATLVVNNSGDAVKAKLRVKMLEENVVQGETKSDRMPEITIPSGESTFHVNDLLPPTAVVFYGGVQNIVTATGKLPEGNYSLCVSLVDAHSGAQLAAPLCKPFTIDVALAPLLTAPESGRVFHTLTGNGQPFLWAPGSLLRESDARYHFKIVEILDGQDASRALRENPPLIEQDVYGATQYMLMPDFTFPRPMHCAWSVQAFDAQGKTFGENDGIAAPFLLECSDDAGKKK